MPDQTYCYPDSNVLRNRKNIRDAKELYDAEIHYTSYRLYELQKSPITGRFDFKHLCAIHRYIFQDLYEWAGKPRTVDIGKGNMFCRVQFIQDYAKDIFSRYFLECDTNKHDRDRFVHTLVTHYADLNALHPFREGNGRSQREFARELCLQCGYVFDLSGTSHGEMLNASILSFDKGDNSSLQSIFRKAIIPFDEYHAKNVAAINILTADDLDIEGIVNSYEYYDN